MRPQFTAVRRRRRRWRAVGAFFKTLPGVLTAIATLLAAVAGLLTALEQVGVINVRSPIVVGRRQSVRPPARRRRRGTGLANGDAWGLFALLLAGGTGWYARHLYRGGSFRFLIIPIPWI